MKRSIWIHTLTIVMNKPALVIVTLVTVIVGASLGKAAFGEVLERDIDEATGNATAGVAPEESIVINPLEALPDNGTVTMNMEGIVDTNMNEIPPPGVTVLISNDSVTVTNHEVTVED
jgi:hypothetical protein